MNPVVSGIVHALIDNGGQAAHITSVRTELTARCAALCDALDAALPPGASFVRPRGGYFVWITLPPGMSAGGLFAHAVSSGHRVKFHPGTKFGPGLDGFIRLSFSYYSAPDLVVGAQRLGDAMRTFAAVPAPVSPPSGLGVAVHGSTGRLGSLIVAAAVPAGVSFVTGLPRAGSPGFALPPGTRVVVDVSLPAGTTALVKALLASPPPHPALVVGTTGDLPLSALHSYAALAPVVFCANFSTGVPLLLSMLGCATGGVSPGWHAAVSEVHHTGKKDAPSGTAVRLVAALEGGGVAAAPGGATPGAVPVVSLRLGDAVGTHTVHLAGPGETLELTHTVTRRDVFAVGALRVAAWAAGQSPGVYRK